MPFTQHRKKMVDHFLWLQAHAPIDYARGAYYTYTRNPDCPCPDILKDIKAAMQLSSQSSQTSSLDSEKS